MVSHCSLSTFPAAIICSFGQLLWLLRTGTSKKIRFYHLKGLGLPKWKIRKFQIFHDLRYDAPLELIFRACFRAFLNLLRCCLSWTLWWLVDCNDDEIHDDGDDAEYENIINTVVMMMMERREDVPLQFVRRWGAANEERGGSSSHKSPAWDPVRIIIVIVIVNYYFSLSLGDHL